MEWTASSMSKSALKYLLCYNIVLFHIVVNCGIPMVHAVNFTTMSISYLSTTYNSSAFYSCGTGYNLVGTSQRVCQFNGSWSEQPAQCQSMEKINNNYCCSQLPTVVDCGDLRVVSGYYGNLNVNFPSTTYNSTAIYICMDSGYRLVGESIRVCNANGNWSGNQPKCGGK